MKLKFVERAGRILAMVVAVVCMFVAGAGVAYADGDASGMEAGLRFRPDGTFTVLLLADLQDTQYASKYLTHSVKGVINDYEPDLIVLLGDQLEGESPLLRLGNRENNVKRAIKTVLAPVVESGIPFTFVFGNHDYDAPLSIAKQMEIYRSFDTCIMADENTGAPGNNVFSLPIYANDGKTQPLCFYFFDSGADQPNGQYGAVSNQQVAWYQNQAAARLQGNGYESVPAVAFMHVAPAEVYDLFQRVSSGQPDSVQGIGAGAEHFYALDSEDLFAGSALEAPCPSDANNGLFKAFVDHSDVFLCAFGHDHVNSFIGMLRGVDLLSAPGSTFTSYNDRDVRGARLLRFSEHNVRDYETVHVRYSDYDGADGLGAVFYHLTVTTGIYNLIKIGLMALLVLVALVLLTISVLRQEKRGRGGELIEEDENDLPEDPYL